MRLMCAVSPDFDRIRKWLTAWRTSVCLFRFIQSVRVSCTIFLLFTVSLLENEKMSDNCLHQVWTFRHRAALFIAARCHVTSRHVQDVITRTDKSSDKAGPSLARGRASRCRVAVRRTQKVGSKLSYDLRRGSLWCVAFLWLSACHSETRITASRIDCSSERGQLLL